MDYPSYHLILVRAFLDSDLGIDSALGEGKVEKLVIDYEGDGYDLEILLERRVESERVRRERKELSKIEGRDKGEGDGTSDRRRVVTFDDEELVTQDYDERKVENKGGMAEVGSLIASGLNKAMDEMRGVVIEDSKRRRGNSEYNEELSEGKKE